jgi:hypothetical protein
MKYALACLLLCACLLEKTPPIVMVRSGDPVRVHRIVILPSDCGTALCKGLDELISADLAFRGYEIVDLARLNAVERTRTEVQVSWHTAGAVGVSSGSSRRVEVRGPTLSDVDVWTLRDELAKMGVDTIVRVRTAEVFGKPPRVAALVRVTRASDAKLVTSAICEIETGSLHSSQTAAGHLLICAASLPDGGEISTHE